MTYRSIITSKKSVWKIRHPIVLQTALHSLMLWRQQQQQQQQQQNKLLCRHINTILRKILLLLDIGNGLCLMFRKKHCSRDTSRLDVDYKMLALAVKFQCHVLGSLPMSSSTITIIIIIMATMIVITKNDRKVDF